VNICDHLRKNIAFAVGHTRLAKLFDVFYHQEQLWRALFFELYQLMELAWNVINGMEPNIAPTELYARLCSAQEQWMSYRAAHSPEHEPGSIEYPLLISCE
jgi:hypothetical protein